MKKPLRDSATFINTDKAAAQKAKKQEQVLQLIQAGAGELALAADAARTQCLDAIKERFDQGIRTLDGSALVAFFAAMETGAPKAIANRIAMHPMRPAEVQDIVEKAEAEAKELKNEERAQRRLEVLRKKLATQEKDRQELAELEAVFTGGQAAAGDTPDPKTATAKPAGKSGDTATA